MTAYPRVEIIDYEHTGRVLAERYRVGPGYLHDVKQRFKERAARKERNG